MTDLSLIISDISVRQDSQGRYCLNDLHKAAGGNNKNRPSYFIENKQTKELIKEISIAGIPAFARTPGVGTFAIKELVYAYAMWISASFSLKVIRAYDALVTPPQAALPEQFFISRVQQGELYTLVSQKSRATKKYKNYFWQRFQEHFKLTGYRYLPASKFEEGMAFLRNLEGDNTDSFVMLSQEELCQLVKNNVTDAACDEANKKKHYHYPKETALPSRPNKDGVINAHAIINGQIEQKPLTRLLKELEQNGCDVSGAEIEYKVMFQLFCEYSETLDQIWEMALNRTQSGFIYNKFI